MPSEHLCSRGPHLILSGPSLCEPDRVYPLKKDNHLVPGSQSKESRPETVWGRGIPGPVPRDVLEVVVSPSPGWDNPNYVPVSTIEQFDRYPFSRRAVDSARRAVGLRNAWSFSLYVCSSFIHSLASSGCFLHHSKDLCPRLQLPDYFSFKLGIPVLFCRLGDEMTHTEASVR